MEFNLIICIDLHLQVKSIKLFYNNTNIINKIFINFIVFYNNYLKSKKKKLIIKKKKQEKWNY